MHHQQAQEFHSTERAATGPPSRILGGAGVVGQVQAADERLLKKGQEPRALGRLSRYSDWPEVGAILDGCVTD